MLLAAYVIENERERARAEGLKEGRAKAYEAVERQMEAHYRRMRAALDAGEPFDEPPPRFRRNRQ